jgi:hypothetical protein
MRKNKIGGNQNRDCRFNNNTIVKLDWYGYHKFIKPSKIISISSKNRSIEFKYDWLRTCMIKHAINNSIITKINP